MRRKGSLSRMQKYQFQGLQGFASLNSRESHLSSQNPLIPRLMVAINYLTDAISSFKFLV